jgi:uncharacterized protein (TIGR00369 family)
MANNKILALLQTQVGQLLNTSFAPPFTQWLSPLLIEISEGYCKFEVIVRKEMTNPLGILHGGVQAAILDEAVGLAGATLNKESPAVSINLSVDFIGQVKEGEKVIAIGKVIRQGRQIIYYHGELQNADGKLIANATTNMLVIRKT